MKSVAIAVGPTCFLGSTYVTIWGGSANLYIGHFSWD